MMKASTLALAPLSWTYGAATRVRLALYRRGVLAVHKVDAPVISVGNITVGGTGKTPFVAWLARAIAQDENASGGHHHRVCILSRGYRRAAPRTRVLVSDGALILADAREGGDEPRLLAEMLQGVAAVVSDSDRFAAARWAVEHLGSTVFILDDGFQHLSLARNLNIVLVDATDPWGGGRLLPGGRLREPLAGLARADCIIITRADQTNDPNALDTLRTEAKRLSGGQAIIFTSRIRTHLVQPLACSAARPAFAEAILRKPMAAFCAIGKPQSFFAHLRSDGYTLNYTRAFPDHHIYTQSEVDTLLREATANKAQGLLTTAKDAVKLSTLRFTLPCYVIEIDLEVTDEDRLLSIVREAIRS